MRNTHLIHIQLASTVIRYVSPHRYLLLIRNDIPIVAYSPLGRGFLSGKYKSVNDLEGSSCVAALDLADL